MKLKKFLMIISAILCLCAACIALAACGSDTPGMFEAENASFGEGTAAKTENGSYILEDAELSGGKYVGDFAVGGNKIIFEFKSDKAVKATLYAALISGTTKQKTEDILVYEAQTVAPSMLKLTVNGEETAYDSVDLMGGQNPELKNIRKEAKLCEISVKEGKNTIAFEVLETVGWFGKTCASPAFDYIRVDCDAKLTAVK